MGLSRFLIVPLLSLLSGLGPLSALATETASRGQGSEMTPAAEARAPARTSSLAGTGEPPPMAQPLPATPEEWLLRMLDANRNGLAFKHPEAFIEWLDGLSEPRFMTALATVALDPNTYPRVLGRGIDPSTARNWAEFADPGLYLRWMLAGVDARFYSAILQRMSDPGKWQRWLTYASRAETYGQMAATLNPATAAKWGEAVMRPENYDPLLKLANPASSLAWVAAFADQVGKQSRSEPGGQWLRLPQTTDAGRGGVIRRY